MKNVTISQLISRTKPVPINDEGTEAIEVKGLSIASIGLLYHEHKDIMTKVVTGDDEVSKSKTDEDKTDIDWTKVVDIAPEFIAKVISKGTGASIADAEQIPAGIQARLVFGIWEASAIDQSMIESAVKKVLAALVSLNTSIGLNN